MNTSQKGWRKPLLLGTSSTSLCSMRYVLSSAIGPLPSVYGEQPIDLMTFTIKSGLGTYVAYGWVLTWNTQGAAISCRDGRGDGDGWREHKMQRFWESERMAKQLMAACSAHDSVSSTRYTESRQCHGHSVWEQTSEPNLPTDEFPSWNSSDWLPSAPDLEGTDFSVTVPPLAQNRNSCHSPRCHFTRGILEVSSPLQSAKN